MEEEEEAVIETRYALYMSLLAVSRIDAWNAVWPLDIIDELYRHHGRYTGADDALQLRCPGVHDQNEASNVGLVRKDQICTLRKDSSRTVTRRIRLA